MGEKKLKDDTEFLSTGNVAKRVSRCTATIRREIYAGRLKARRFNKDFLIDVNDFEAWKAKYFKPVE